MDHPNVSSEKRGRVAVVTINRPDKMNALSTETWRDLIAVFDDLRTDEEVRVVVVTGAGNKAFIGGADIREFAGTRAVAQNKLFGSWDFSLMEEFPKPVIAMINGYALGGGCEVAMSCDIRIASSEAKFGQPEIKLGIIPGGGGTQRLPRLIGEGKAMELILTGDMIGAQEAHNMGLVNHVVPPDQLEARTMELAARIAEMSPVALSMAKRAVKNAARTDLRAGLELEMHLMALCFSTEDKEEGVRAFLEKRKPQFKGR